MFQIESKFKLLETMPVPDPWGMGMTFDVHPLTHKPFQAWWKRTYGPSDAEKNLEALKRWLPKDAAAEAIKAKLAEGLPEPPDPMALVEGVALLLEGWSGVLDQDGGEVEFSTDAAQLLFALENTIDEPVEMPDGNRQPAGAPVGITLAMWLLQHANNLQRVQTSQVEDAEKN